MQRFELQFRERTWNGPLLAVCCIGLPRQALHNTCTIDIRTMQGLLRQGRSMFALETEVRTIVCGIACIAHAQHDTWVERRHSVTCIDTRKSMWDIHTNRQTDKHTHTCLKARIQQAAGGANQLSFEQLVGTIMRRITVNITVHILQSKNHEVVG